MNLAVITNILTPYRIPLFAEMSRQVSSLDVLLMARQEENRDWHLGESRLKTHVLPGIHLKPPWREVSFHVNYNVRKILRSLSPDVVLSGGYSPANIAAFLYCRSHKRKFVSWGELTLRGSDMKSPAKLLIRRLLSRGGDAAISSSSEAREAFIQLGARPDRVETVVMPLEVVKIHKRVTTYRKSKECAADKRKYPGPVVLSVGRITDYKGYRELFAVYELLTAEGRRPTLLIVGDGPERQKYERMVRDRGWRNVHFIGFVQQDDLYRYWAIADLFIFHSLFDPFGAVPLEAMAAGLPVLSSIHAASTADVISDGVNGFRIDPRDTAGTAATVRRVMDMGEDELTSICESAIRSVMAFDIAPSAARMVDFLGRVVTV